MHSRLKSDQRTLDDHRTLRRIESTSGRAGDERDSGQYRIFLNYGHTVGHAP